MLWSRIIILSFQVDWKSVSLNNNACQSIPLPQTSVIVFNFIPKLSSEAWRRLFLKTDTLIPPSHSITSLSVLGWLISGPRRLFASQARFNHTAITADSARYPISFQFVRVSMFKISIELIAAGAASQTTWIRDARASPIQFRKATCWYHYCGSRSSGCFSAVLEYARGRGKWACCCGQPKARRLSMASFCLFGLLHVNSLILTGAVPVSFRATYPLPCAPNHSIQDRDEPLCFKVTKSRPLSALHENEFLNHHRRALVTAIFAFNSDKD